MASPFQFQSEQDGIRQEANQWLARFAPLVMDEALPYELELIHRRIKTVTELKEKSPDLTKRLSELNGEGDAELSDTLVRAAAQLDSLDQDLRRQLSKVAPGDPLGIVDINALQDRLAERQAQQEIGVGQTDFVPVVLELETSPPSVAGALGMGIFGLGWTAFTTVHCALMVGGFSKAIGLWALGLLAFYAIFFAVGFGMLYAALNSICRESIELDGRKLTIKRTLGGWVRSRTVQLAADTRASVGSPQSETSVQSRNSVPVFAVNLTDERGKGVSLGTSTTREFKEKIAKQINEYLAVYG